MKQCPFCAEEVQDTAIKCRHCQSDLEKPVKSKKKGPGLIAKILFGGFVFLIVISLFNAILDSNARDKSAEVTAQEQQKAADIQAYVAANSPTDTRYVWDSLLYAQTIAVNLIEPAPAIDLLASGITFSSSSASDDYASVPRVASVERGQKVDVYKDELGDDGTANYTLISFIDTQGTDSVGWIDSDYLLGASDYSTASAQFNASAAGKLCNKHTDWKYTDCQSVADGKVWIGMTIDMLKEERGNPNAANPSNYGSGTKWQWCWTYKTPSCFYDNNNDGVIDSYN